MQGNNTRLRFESSFVPGYPEWGKTLKHSLLPLRMEPASDLPGDPIGLAAGADAGNVACLEVVVNGHLHRGGILNLQRAPSPS